MLYDITRRKRVETEVRRRAEHGPLTGALDRSAIDAAIDRFSAYAGNGADGALTLLYLDLDGFRQILSLRHCSRTKAVSDADREPGGPSAAIAAQRQ